VFLFTELVVMAAVDDLATLSELDENGILAELLARYNKDIIYVRACQLNNINY
jgi:myosin heavy subunit